MDKAITLFIVAFLLLSSSFIGVSNTTERVAVDVEEMDDIAFCSYDEHGMSKASYYREHLQLIDYSDDDVELEELTIPVESSPITSDGPMDSPWPMKCHDNNHTGRSPYGTANISYIEKWRFECYTVEDMNPAIDEDGTIYFGGGYNDIRWYLHALYPNGTIKWSFQTYGLMAGSSPAIAEDGTIYIGSWDDRLYAIYPDGTKKWSFNAGDTIASSPSIADDGTIYFGTMGTGHYIFAISPNGTEKWRYPTGYYITSHPAIGPDGTVYIGSGDTYLYAMNPNGTLKWRFKTGHYIKGSPSIADDGTVYIGSYDDYLYALYPDNGMIKWKCKVGHGTETNPSIASDGTIYVGGSKLFAVHPNGTIKWEFYLGTNRHIHQSSPTICADGIIYVGTNIGDGAGGDIIAVNPDGAERWRKRIADNWVDSTPTIAPDGTVYIGSNYDAGTGYLHAFGTVESNMPPEAPTIDGPTWGRAGNELWFAIGAHDPDNNPVSFYIDWGDNTTTGWTREHGSGEKYYYEHTWSEEGTYTIKAKARDVFGEESDWGDSFEVETVKSKNVFLLGKIHDYRYIPQRDEYEFKVENLILIQFKPFSYHRYHSDEQFHIVTTIRGIVWKGRIFGFFNVYSKGL